MGERFQTRQAQKTASALYGVHQPKDIGENLLVVGILLETHQLDVNDIQAFIGLGQKLTQQVVHNEPSRSGANDAARVSRERAQYRPEGFNFGCSLAAR